jgi:hypothetical protein
LIVADGETYFACKDLVWVSSEGGTFKVDFTDADGLNHVLRGIKKVYVSDIPKRVDAPMPYPLPDVNGEDSSGLSYKPGAVYGWDDGSKAMLKGGVWTPIKVPNTACTAQ